MKWFKRFLLLVAFALVATLAVVTWKARQNPAWYRHIEMSEEEIAALSHQAANKLNIINNMADRAHAIESAARKGATRPTTVPGETIRITQEELTALFLDLTAPDRQKIEKYFVDPEIHLEEGQIVVAATVKDMGRVISIHLEPRLDEQGKLDLNLTSVYFGEMPVPESFPPLAGQIARVEGMLAEHLPEWQREAQLSPRGGSNAEAANASLAELALDVLHHRTAPPVFFPRFVDPVKLTELKVEDGAITLRMEPLTEVQRKEALHEVRKPRADVKEQ